MEHDDNEDSLFWEDTDNIYEKIIQELENSLEREKHRRREERFVWILISVILLNIFVFISMQSFLGPLVIGIFEAVALLLVARKMGLEEVVIFIDRLIATVSRTSNN